MTDFWISVTTDVVTGIAYLCVTATACLIVRKARFKFSFLLVWVAFLAGFRAIGHFIEAAMLWYPAPAVWLMIKAFVAFASVAAAVWSYRLRKDFIALAKISELAVQSQIELSKAKIELEERVKQRTAELENANHLLAESKNRAEVANHAKSQFLANMSHEIRTPLAAILGFSELLVKQKMSPSEVNKSLSTILRNSRHLANLIDEVLDLSKVESGSLEIERLSFQLSDVLEYVSSVVSLKAHEKNVRVRMSVDSDVPRFITTDPTRLKQILVNLVGNAVKFTEQGIVEVQVCNGGANELGFTIRDSGIGIPLADHAKLFIPFSQSDSSTSRKFGGTGLGLSLSKKLANALGGDVGLVRSEPGNGAEFLVTIPVGAEQSDVRRDAELMTENVERMNFRELRILVVDDSPDNLDLVQALLRTSGASVSVAENGQQAVDRVMTEEFDIVLMDVQMPVLDGHAATKLLRTQGYRKPIIAFTANAFRDDRIRAYTAGFDDYLTKPIHETNLFSAIARYAKRDKKFDDLRVISRV